MWSTSPKVSLFPGDSQARLWGRSGVCTATLPLTPSPPCTRTASTSPKAFPEATTHTCVYHKRVALTLTLDPCHCCNTQFASTEAWQAQQYLQLFVHDKLHFTGALPSSGSTLASKHVYVQAAAAAAAEGA